MERIETLGLFEEENRIDDASAKLAIAKAILEALHNDHNDLKQKPELQQRDISALIYAALRLVEEANVSVQAMPFEAGWRVTKIKQAA